VLVCAGRPTCWTRPRWATSSVRQLLDQLERQAIAGVLDAARDAESTRIFIGSGTACSVRLVGDRFAVARCEGRVVGVVGVIGPTRLNYARVVPMVDFTAQSLGKLIGQDGFSKMTDNETRPLESCTGGTEGCARGTDRFGGQRRGLASCARSSRRRSRTSFTPRRKRRTCAAAWKRTSRARALCRDRVRARHVSWPTTCARAGSIPADLRDDEKFKNLVAGLEATGREIEKVFAGHGISRIAATGLPLDPHQHQAMMEVPSADAEPGTVLQELQAIHDQGPPAATRDGGRGQKPD
jgi:molecular chaperone GrpE